MAIYHRVESPTQTTEVARRQERAGEIWGKAPRWSGIAKVKAYTGPLPEGKAGIEFATEVPPDLGCPPGQAHWSGPREGVIVDGDYAKIRVRINRNTQRSGENE